MCLSVENDEINRGEVTGRGYIEFYDFYVEIVYMQLTDRFFFALGLYIWIYASICVFVSLCSHSKECMYLQTLTPNLYIFTLFYNTYRVCLCNNAFDNKLPFLLITVLNWISYYWFFFVCLVPLHEHISMGLFFSLRSHFFLYKQRISVIFR